MPTPEKDPEPIEKQEQLYPMTDAKRGLIEKLFEVKDKTVEITAYGKDGPHTFGQALEELIPDQEKREAVLAQAVKNGFNVNLVHPGDKISTATATKKVDGKNRISEFVNIETKAGKYTIPLGSYAKESVPANFNVVEKRADVKEQTRKAWTNLDEALKSGILVDILKAMGRDSSFAARKELWKDAALTKAEYKGSVLQNQALVEYLKQTKKPKAL